MAGPSSTVALAADGVAGPSSTVSRRAPTPRRGRSSGPASVRSEPRRRSSVRRASQRRASRTPDRGWAVRECRVPAVGDGRMSRAGGREDGRACERGHPARAEDGRATRTSHRSRTEPARATPASNRARIEDARASSGSGLVAARPRLTVRSRAPWVEQTPVERGRSALAFSPRPGRASRWRGACANAAGRAVRHRGAAKAPNGRASWAGGAGANAHRRAWARLGRPSRPGCGGPCRDASAPWLQAGSGKTDSLGLWRASAGSPLREVIPAGRGGPARHAARGLDHGTVAAPAPARSAPSREAQRGR